jgi:ABC-2 type transport system ATP-binding protein
VHTFHAARDRSRISELLKRLAEQGIDFVDLQMRESSLEEIFVSLVRPES